MSRILSILLAGSVVFTSVACQKSKEAPTGNDTVRPLYLGDLDKKLNEIYGKDNEEMMDVCDKQWRPKILEIARVLEEKRQDIEALSQKNNAEKNIVGVDFGSFKFIDDMGKPTGADEWTHIQIRYSKQGV